MARRSAFKVSLHPSTADASHTKSEQLNKEEPPSEKKQRKKRRESSAPKTEKDLLLDSVLEALPEPKAPGQGRARRRVTTAALTGTPVAPQTGE